MKNIIEVDDIKYAVCDQCGRCITNTGSGWDHEGTVMRHKTKPSEDHGLELVGSDDNVFEFEEWKEDSVDRLLMDYDGHGYKSNGVVMITRKDGKHATVHPSDVTDHGMDATSCGWSHIIWFNR